MCLNKENQVSKRLLVFIIKTKIYTNFLKKIFYQKNYHQKIRKSFEKSDFVFIKNDLTI